MSFGGVDGVASLYTLPSEEEWRESEACTRWDTIGLVAHGGGDDQVQRLPWWWKCRRNLMVAASSGVNVMFGSGNGSSK